MSVFAQFFNHSMRTLNRPAERNFTANGELLSNVDALNTGFSKLSQNVKYLNTRLARFINEFTEMNIIECLVSLCVKPGK